MALTPRALYASFQEDSKRCEVRRSCIAYMYSAKATSKRNPITGERDSAADGDSHLDAEFIAIPPVSG
jgi:hypothetical protein